MDDEILSPEQQKTAAAKADEAIVSPPGAVEIGGTTYLVAVPTEKDIFAIFVNAKRQAAKLYNPLREAMDSLAGLPCSEELRTAILMQAHRVKVSGEVPPETITEYLTSAKGCAFYAWILIRKSHPEVTLEKLQSAINDDSALTIFADLDEASGARLVHKSFEAAGFFPRP